MISCQIPDSNDWGDVDPLDYDGKSAFKVFFGKNIDEAMILFRENIVERSSELDSMPDKPFTYYVRGLKKYILSDMLKESDRSDSVSIFLSLFKWRLERSPTALQDVFDDFDDFLYYLAKNQREYDACEEIYGDFMSLYLEIKKLAKKM